MFIHGSLCLTIALFGSLLHHFAGRYSQELLNLDQGTTKTGRNEMKNNVETKSQVKISTGTESRTTPITDQDNLQDTNTFLNLRTIASYRGTYWKHTQLISTIVHAFLYDSLKVRELHDSYH